MWRRERGKKRNVGEKIWELISYKADIGCIMRGTNFVLLGLNYINRDIWLNMKMKLMRLFGWALIEYNWCPYKKRSTLVHTASANLYKKKKLMVAQ